ncbi:hypothetical protein [Roseiconus nitratireducens]|uniref:hypothetical protein n=1 Tax=Roseiconus nitratireducens TaxID=2605748 RepID=UPI001375A053|nr:hypothetical protein [Roseiconus nitratireducens]
MNSEDTEPTPDEPKEQKETKIHAEEAKDRQTTHWDMDYLPANQIEDAYKEGEEDGDA